MEKDVFELLRELDIEEEFKNSAKRYTHYHKHAIKGSNRYNELGFRLFPDGKFKNLREYEKAADDLANDTSSNVVEVVNEKTGKHLKYNKDKNYLVIYKPNSNMPSGNLIYTFFMADEEMFEVIEEHFLLES